MQQNIAQKAAASLRQAAGRWRQPAMIYCIFAYTWRKICMEAKVYDKLPPSRRPQAPLNDASHDIAPEVR